MLIIRGGINSKKRELCPTALALSAFYYNKNKHADTYIMYLHAYSTRDTRKSAHCLWLVGHTPGVFKRGKDTEWDANCGMEEIREFCFKEFAVACLFWNFFVLYYSNNITYHPKEVYAYCGTFRSFLSPKDRRELFVCINVARGL